MQKEKPYNSEESEPLLTRRIALKGCKDNT